MITIIDNIGIDPAIQSGSEQDAEFFTRCVRAVTNAATRHGVDKYKLAEELQDGKALDLALMSQDDIEMKMEELQRLADLAHIELGQLHLITNELSQRAESGKSGVSEEFRPEGV